MRFERALSHRLSESCACPEQAWQRARDMALASEATPAKPRQNRVALAGATLAAAAAIALALSNAIPGFLDGVPNSQVVHAAETVAELAAESETAPGWESVQAYLDAHGIRLTLTERSRILSIIRHRKVDIIGARQVQFAGTDVIEILVDCCDRPVKLILAPQHSRAARALGRAAAEDGYDVQATRKVSGYVVAAVAIHPAHGLVDLVH
jgi:hypothetical protein